VKLAFFLAAGMMWGIAAPSVAHDGGHAAQVPWQQASEWPDRIIATIDGDPATSITISWRTAGTVTQTSAEIAEALPDARFDQTAIALQAQTQVRDLTQAERGGIFVPVEHNQGLPPTGHHSVRFDGLEPDTLYAYRVQGAEGHWSEWFQTRTAPRTGPVRFIYLGDAQNGLDSHWPRIMRAAFQSAPDARFILHAGDLVNRGSRDLEWAHWFRAGGFINGMIPAIPVAGNHEYERVGLSEADGQRVLSFLWRPQFRLPEEPTLSEDLRETVYDIRYSSDVHVFVLNSNVSDMSEQAGWLDRELAQSDARWRIVAMHHPIYSSGRDRDNPEKRAVLLPVLLKHRVDLVLQGHDHTYARGAVGVEGQSPARQAATDGEQVTTMFVNSVSGPKQYEFSEDGWRQYAASGVTLDRMAENTQFYQIISIDGDELHYVAHTADGAIYDEVRLCKPANGTKTISSDQDALPPTRRFDNTLPYQSVGG
jgi:predicted phosphodiesterase